MILSQHPLRQLAPISQLLKQYGFMADKRLGQHFLFDLNITDKIARSAGSLTDATVLEVGPGPGALTRSLLEAGSKQVLALEMDPRFVHMLNDYLVPVSEGRLTVLEQNALHFDYTSLKAPLHIIANLPYNVATELVFRWLEQATHATCLTLMFQKEVADRLAASPRCKAYGKLSILVQRLFLIESLFDIPASAFYPPPKITSTVLQMIPREVPIACQDPKALTKLLAASFGQRRKTLRASLKSITPEAENLLIRAQIDPNARPETLSVIEFCRLADLFSDYTRYL